MFDFIIVGAGIIGCSTAYHLTRLEPNCRVLLIDQYSDAGKGNTGKSAAMFRNIFSSKTSQALANSSIAFYGSLAKEFHFTPHGYLWLFSKDNWPRAKDFLNNPYAHNAGISSLSLNKIQSLIQINSTSSNEFPGIYKGLFGSQCGSLSANALVRYYLNAFLQQGGEFLGNTNIKTLTFSNKREYFPPWSPMSLHYIISSTGKKLSAGQFCFATGAWTAELFIPLGINPGVLPKKRQLFAIKTSRPSFFPQSLSKNTPAIIFPKGGIYIKPSKNPAILTLGCSDTLGNPFIRAEESPQADQGYYNTIIQPPLNHYFPMLPPYSVTTAWAGYYSYYTPDNNPVIDSVHNCTWVSGTSGSGIMKADAIGRITAAKLLGRKRATLFSGQQFTVANLSLSHRNVDKEELVL